MKFNDVLSQILSDIQSEMSRNGDWETSDLPSEAEIQADCLKLIQFFYLPATQNALDGKAEWPGYRNVARALADHFGDESTHSRFLQLLQRLEFILQKQVYRLRGPLESAGDAIDQARQEAWEALLGQEEEDGHYLNAVYNISAKLVKACGSVSWKPNELPEGIKQKLTDALICSSWVNDFGTRDDDGNPPLTHGRALMMHGQTLFYLGRYQDAWPVLHLGYEKLDKTWTEWRYCAHYIALICMSSGAAAQAMPYLEKLLAHHPDEENSISNLAACRKALAQS